jgi:hypothetical protein
MSPAPVKIKRIIRRMRGGSQAQLVQGCDGNFYVAKFLGNPQGNRTLINEWIACSLLRGLGVLTPSLRVLELPQSFKSHEDLHFLVGNRRTPLEGVVHLGSQCPVNPEKTAIFDFLPDRLLPKVGNLTEFATMFVFDHWIGQTDTRQAVFIRDRSITADIGFLAYFVDHGMAFDGGHWQLRDQRLSGLAFQSNLYALLDLLTLVETALCRVESIDEATLFAATNGVPSSWFAPGDRGSLYALLAKLRQRQLILRPLIARHLQILYEYAGARPGLS